ncbi:MAG TPA: ABC transporter substrate-binding protein, partial [Micropepsaceae bacterium]|nr:ABC transporter substrate-binding protein [Micropepsaceae bacterium]
MNYLKIAAAGLLASAVGFGSAQAQETVKIGLVIAMTGQQASTGKQIKAAVDLYMKEHGDTVAGKKIQVILRDSGSVPDNSKRLSQELIV